MILQQLRGQADGVGGQHRAVGPHFQRQLVVVGDLAQTSSFDHVVDTAHRRVDRVDRNEAQTEVGIKVLVGRDIATPTLQAHLHVQAAAFRHRGDVHILVQNLNVTVGFDHAAGHDARLVSAQVQRLGTLTGELEGNLLQVQDDVGCVFDNSRDGLELVQYVFDADGRHCSALDGTQQGATQRVADGGAKAPLKRLGAELAVSLS